MVGYIGQNLLCLDKNAKSYNHFKPLLRESVLMTNDNTLLTLYDMTMKNLLTIIAVAIIGILQANAMTEREVRENARFLSDRMAYELKLTNAQYEDCYEINYDFLSAINPQMSYVCVGRQSAINAYYDYLDARNEDLRYILNRTQYLAFMDLDYFFRPIYTTAGRWLFRVHQHYHDLTHFYYHTPSIYLTYHGAHARHHYHNGYYGGRYHHDVYAHARPSREHLHHDFHHDSHRDAHHAPHHDAHKGNRNEIHRDSHHETKKDSHNANRGSRTDNHHQSGARSTPRGKASHGGNGGHNGNRNSHPSNRR